MGEAERVELAGDRRQEGGRAAEGKPVADIGLVEQLDLDPGLPARAVLPLQHLLVRAAAGEVETPRRPPGAAVLGQVTDAADGVEAEPIAPHRVVQSTPLDQVDEMGVDLVLDERRRRGGAAVADLAGLEQHRGDALPGEPMGHEGAGDPAADNGDVAMEVLVKTGIHGGKAVDDRPERVAAGQVHGSTYPARRAALRLRRVRAPGVALALGLVALSPAHQSPPDAAFVDVTLVPLDTARVLLHQTVVVRDGRIASIGPAAAVQPPPGALRIDGRGRYLMPGLVDMHVHLFDSRDLLLYLANGVTTIRNLGGYAAADSILELRRQVAAGERLGPAIVTSGNWLDGDPPFRNINTVLRTPAEARDEVRREKRLGYDFIKVYATLRPEVYQAIVRAAREEGIPVTGHIPGPVGLEAVLAGGQVAIDHAAPLAREGEPATVARRVRDAHVAVTTTLVMLDIARVLRGAPERLDSMLARPEARYLSAETRAFWRRAPFLTLPRDDTFTALYADTEALVRALSDAHAQLLVGTDAGLWGNVPGWSTVREIELLVASGLTPYQALRAATVEPARFLERTVPGAGVPGALAVGNRADLVVLEQDPLRDVAALERRVGVMVRGEWLDTGRLDALLAELAAERAREPEPAGAE